MNWWDYGIQSIEARRSFLDYLRKWAGSPLVVTHRGALRALMIGKVDLAVAPQSEVRARLMTELYMRDANDHVLKAWDDFFETGLGGVSITPLGINPLTPDNCYVYGDWHSPSILLRFFILSPENAYFFFGRKQAIREGVKRWRSSISRRRDLGTKPLSVDDEEVVVARDGLMFLEVQKDDEYEYWFDGQLVDRKKRKPFHNYHLLLGGRRYDPIEAGELVKRRSLPIGHLEELVGLNQQEIDGIDSGMSGVGKMPTVASRPNLVAWHDYLSFMVMSKSLRTTLAVYNSDAFKQMFDSPEFTEMRDRLVMVGFTPDRFAGNQIPIHILDNVSMNELLMAYDLVYNMVTRLTGVNRWMLSEAGITKVATEVITMRNESSIRTNALQLHVQRWLNNFLRDLRAYYVFLDKKYQPAVEFWLQTGDEHRPWEFFSFGFANPYDTVLSNCQVTLASSGFQDILTKRQDTQAVLMFMMEAFPLLAQATNASYDITKFVDDWLSSYGFDPSEYKMDVPFNPNDPPDSTFSSDRVFPDKGEGKRGYGPQPAEGQATVSGSRKSFLKGT